MNRAFSFLFIALVWLSMPFGAFGAEAPAFDLSQYQEFLDRYLVQDRQIKGYRLNLVNYRDIFEHKDDPESLYRRVLTEFSSFDPAALKTREEKVSFWINAYNIGAIKMVMDHYPVDSIRARKISFFRNPWNMKILEVGGKEYALGEIEHEILLGRLKEPLAHFAIVCASLSCPELAPRAYEAGTVREQMEEQARAFLSDPKKGLRIDSDEGVVYFSQIFRFDKKTFPKGAEDAVPLIAPLVEEENRDYLNSGDYKVKYLDYDWSLNSLSGSR